MVLAVAVVVCVSRRHELVMALRLIADAYWPRLLLAAGCEAASLFCLVGLQSWILRAGGRQLSLRSVGAVVLAANAVAGALPGGAAFAAAWEFRQLRLRGVGQALAGAVLVIAGTLSGISLFALLLLGLAFEGSSGPGAGLRPAAVSIAVLGIVVVAVSYALWQFQSVRWRVRRAWRRVRLRSRGLRRLSADVSWLGRQFRAAEPGIRPWFRPTGLALLNWLFDMACLAACMWSLGIAIPEHGFVASYALTQIAGSLRLTPGGLVVVEASLTALLVVSGLHVEQALAVTLVYRLMSYWALQPLGWACWLGVTLRAGRRAPGG
ncbi:YbhN family protein [Streptomyces sp. NPDC047315]|uniref:lysylphosphatidylglycerol synthase transmembrane domain-containing protein n=1 Tax=Streptomyces sp. NPDC047315 TaxID=3155142 RepID=UPI003403F368